MTMDLDKLKARIQALRAKTVDNGCTEQEALSAAAKVAELLDQYDLSLSDVEMRGQECEQGVIETNRKQRQPISSCLGAIGEFCDCKVWMEKDQQGKIRYVFFGLNAGVVMARYVYEVIEAAMSAEWERFRKAQRFVRYASDPKTSFQFGMAVSIADKLVAMKAARDQAINGGGGRQLVLVKHAIIDKEFAALNLALRRGRASGRRVAPAAFEAGQAAGDNLTLRVPVEGR